MKTKVLVTILLLISGAAIAQPSYSSYDTIPSRYRNYHYTEWYDECPAYQNGGMLDSCNYEWYLPWSIIGGAFIAKYEYTDHPIKVRGLAAMVDRSGQSNRQYKDSTMGEQYLYLLRRIDWVDTINPSPRPGFFRMNIVDSIRYDTVKPKLMAISQAYPGFPDQYVYMYEVYFDTPIEVDSIFYIHGSQKDHYDPVTETLDYWPFLFCDIRPQYHWLGCGERNSHVCKPQGQNNTLEYCGHTDYSYVGYPQIGNDVWCFTDHYFNYDPYGIFFAIVNHYELKLYSDSLPMGRVEGAGWYDDNQMVECRAISNPGFAFSHWNDGSTENPRRLLLTQDTSFTAYFTDSAVCSVQVLANDDEWGTTGGSGWYVRNSTVTISATPNERYLFDRWSDGEWQNPRTFTLTQDTVFTAQFAPDPTYVGIDAPDPSQSFTLSPNPASGELTVTFNRAGEYTIEILDLRGVTMIRSTVDGKFSANAIGTATGSSFTLDISSLPAATYLVRISTGHGTAFKKLVVK